MDDEFQRDLDSWLAKQFADLPTTRDLTYQQALDPRSSLSAASPRAFKPLEEWAEALETSLLTFARRRPDFQAIQDRADDIADFLQVVGALENPKLIASALKILELSIVPLAQGGKWDLLDERMNNLMPVITNHADPESKLRWFKLWIKHLNYAGLRCQLRLVEELRAAYEQAGKVPDETELKFLALLRAGNSPKVERQLANELLRSITEQQDTALLLRLHIMLAYLHGERYEYEQLFEQGQLAYDLAVKLGNVRSQITALTYMATACHALDRLSEATAYIELAEPLAEQTNDLVSLMNLKAAHSTYLYSLQQYSAVVAVLSEAAPHFPARGIIFGRAMYILGISHIGLQLYSEAERILLHARDLFLKLESYVDILNTELALTDCYVLEPEEEANNKIRAQLNKRIIPLCQQHREALPQQHLDLVRQLNARYGDRHFDF